MARRRDIGTPTGQAIIPSYTDVDTQSYTRLPDGRLVEATVFGLTAEQVEMVRQGYVCIKCLEAHDIAFPEQCAVCRFPMKAKQLDEFGKQFRGEIKFGPSTSIDEEYEIAEETIQRDAYDKARDLGLILPKWY